MIAIYQTGIYQAKIKWQCVNGAKEWIGTELTFDLR